jgi:hypothetical protein
MGLCIGILEETPHHTGRAAHTRLRIARFQHGDCAPGSHAGKLTSLRTMPAACRPRSPGWLKHPSALHAAFLSSRLAPCKHPKPCRSPRAFSIHDGPVAVPFQAGVCAIPGCKPGLRDPIVAIVAAPAWFLVIFGLAMAGPVVACVVGPEWRRRRANVAPPWSVVEGR